MVSVSCYCCSLSLFENCCAPYINGIKKAPTALLLMRSRYAAYVTHQADYLLATTHISQRKYYSKSDILHWANSNQWQKLEIISFTENTVNFKAYFIDENKDNKIHHELSTFVFENGSWFYVDGSFF
jgi:SEC-C motif-containing protein